MSSEKLRLGRRTVEVSNPDKIYFPDAGITKAELVGYYRDIAETMLPFLDGRPLTLHRFPDGIDGDGFFQQKRPDYFPDWVKGADLPRREGGSVVHTVVDGVAALVVVANSGCITPHLWLSRSDEPERPDQLVFDLDPPGDGDRGFDEVRFAALSLREMLDELGLVPLVKTTGSKGLHVVVPLRREHDFDDVRDFARRAAEILARRHPQRLTTEQRKQKRDGRVFLDVMRNAYGQHAVAPYAVRALPLAPVAAPVDWSELDDRDLGPRDFTVSTIRRRLDHRGDPWKGAWRRARSLARPLEKLKEVSRD